MDVGKVFAWTLLIIGIVIPLGCMIFVLYAVLCYGVGIKP